MNSAGDYNLYAETPFGGRATSVVHASQSRTRGLVPDLVKPTITPLIASDDDTETGKLDEKVIKSGEAKSCKSEEDGVDSSIADSVVVDYTLNETDETDESLLSDESYPSNMLNNDGRLTATAPLISNSSSVKSVDSSVEGILDSAGSVNINDNT